MFLIPLLLGFALNSASAFTAAYSRRWGERVGRWVTVLLRDVLGIPLWVLGLAMAMATPSDLVLSSGPASEVLAWLLIGAGCAEVAAGLLALGRRAAAPSLRDTLVERGVYAWVRHPLYGGVILEFAGLALLRPTQAVVLACLLGIAWAPIQARLEELDLVQRMPAYRAYMERVPRFIPRFGQPDRRPRV